jgi:hypothetical protein
MTQYPNSFLQSESQPWGRSVEQRLADLERQDRLVAQESGNNFAQINSSITLLSQQVQSIVKSTDGVDLLLQSKGALSSGGFSRASNGTTNSPGSLPSLTIVLAKPARVILTTSAIVQCNANQSSINTDFAAYMDWTASNNPTFPRYGVSYVGRLTPSPFTNLFNTASVSSSQVITFNSGTYTFAPITGRLELNGHVGAVLQATEISLHALVLPF